MILNLHPCQSDRLLDVFNPRPSNFFLSYVILRKNLLWSVQRIGDWGVIASLHGTSAEELLSAGTHGRWTCFSLRRSKIVFAELSWGKKGSTLISRNGGKDILTYKWDFFSQPPNTKAASPLGAVLNDPRSRPQIGNHFRDVMIDDEGSCKRVTHALFVNQWISIVLKSRTIISTYATMLNKAKNKFGHLRRFVMYQRISTSGYHLSRHASFSRETRLTFICLRNAFLLP